VRVKGKDYVFSDLDELVYFVSRQEVEVERAAEKKAERDAKRIISTGRKSTPKAPVFEMESAVPEIRDYIAAVQKQVEQAYWVALADALGREAEELEDIKYIASIL